MFDFQIYTFGIAGERLTERLRGMMFEAMMRMEIAWFDDRANGTGSLCARLSGDASAVQGVSTNSNKFPLIFIKIISYILN